MRQPHYLGSGQSEDGGREGATSQSRPPPRNLLRVVGSLVFLYSLFGDDSMEGALPSSTDAVCRATSTSMAALMARVDETNPLGADLIIERRLRREAEAQTSASPGAAGAAHFAVQLILAHVHELRSSMVAAHDAVVATLTLAGHHRRPPKNQGTMPATYSVAPAPYSERWLVEMDGIGRRLFPGHEPPRSALAGSVSVWIAHTSVVEGATQSTHEDGLGMCPGGKVIYARSGALVARILESAGLGFRHGDSCGLVVRGLVVQCVLENCPLQSNLVFKEVLSLLTVLWTSFRRHLKVELTILFNDVILRVLRSPHAPPERKVDVETLTSVDCPAC